MSYSPAVQFEALIHKFSESIQRMSALVQELTPSHLQISETITTCKLGNSVVIALIQIWLACSYKFILKTCNTWSLGCVAFELRVRKLVAVQSCEGGNKLAPCYLEISTEHRTSAQGKARQYGVISVTIVA
jgi:hypothetical protein